MRVRVEVDGGVCDVYKRVAGAERVFEVPVFELWMALQTRFPLAENF